MKYRKFDKIEKKENQQQALRKAMSGEGLYLYENKLNSELNLPRPTNSGLRTVGPKCQFQGDNYYLQLVRSGELRLIKELQSPEQEHLMENERLILDQPEIITQQGKVEHVVETKPQTQVNETESSEVEVDVLINEAPSDDGFFIVD